MGTGVWSFCLDLPSAGCRRRQVRRGGFATRRAALDAREFLINPQDVLRAGEIVTVGEWLRWWIDQLDLRDTTLDGYRSRLRLYLIPLLGDYLLRELTGVRVQAAFTSIVRTGGVAGYPLATGSLERIRATLRAALNYAVSMELLDHNPARHVKLPKGERPHAVVWTRPMMACGKRPASGPRSRCGR